MKTIRLISITSVVLMSVSSSIALGQDLSTTRPRRVKDVPQQISGDPVRSVDSAVTDDATSPANEPATRILPTWISLEKPGSSTTLQSGSERFLFPRVSTTRTAGPLASNAANGPFVNVKSASAVSAKMPNQNSHVKILSPQANDRFASKQIMVSVQYDSSVDNIQLLITKKGVAPAPDTIAYDSGLTRVQGKSNPWMCKVELSGGEFEIEAIGRDKNGTRVDSGAVSVTGIKHEKGDAPDDRGPFDASFYLGYGIDSFAASELRTYLNPKASGEIEERLIGGFDFAYRLFGDPMMAKGKQLWLYGETVHGVRSADVDCTANKDQPLCQDLLGGQNPSGQLVAILRNASSLEAFAGIRWEFAGFNLGSISPAKAYLKSQFGFVTVAGLGGDVVDLHDYIAAGFTSTRGPLKNSYVELGYGRSDFFLDNKNKRWKIDGFLSFGFADSGPGSLMRPFAQITVDSDFKKGSDSVQTYLGIDFDLSFLWGKPK